MQRFFPTPAWALAAFVAILVAGLIDLAQPLEGDQSLFLIGAHEMARGAVLYRDFWDLKQPGIFDFYYVAGVLGGFNALAVHGLELAYFLAFAVVITYAVSCSQTLAPATRLAALFAIVPYYVVAASPQQLQVEGLAGFPILVSAWLACEGTQRSGRARYIAFAGAGLAAGCALVLKLVFAPLLIAIFVTAVAFGSGAYRPSWRVVLLAAATFLCGAALPMLATIATLAHGGALGIALDTWIAVPPRIVGTLPTQTSAILIGGIEWFVKGYAAAIVLAVAAVVVLVRSGKSDAMYRCLVVWIVAGVATVLAQRTSWWEYQWLLLSVPLGVLAAFGTAALARMPRTVSGTVVLAFAALLALVPARTEIRKVAVLTQHHFALDADDRERYRDAVSSAYAGMRADAALLPPRADVYVMGNPIYYVLTGRLQPLVLNGWSLELMLPEERAELLREFQGQPPRYVYASRDDIGISTVMRRDPDLAAYFARHYTIVARGAFGTLYRLGEPKSIRGRAE